MNIMARVATATNLTLHTLPAVVLYYTLKEISTMAAYAPADMPIR